jgi:hypothetical protein
VVAEPPVVPAPLEEPTAPPDVPGPLEEVEVSTPPVVPMAPEVVDDAAPLDEPADEDEEPCPPLLPAEAVDVLDEAVAPPEEALVPPEEALALPEVAPDEVVDLEPVVAPPSTRRTGPLFWHAPVKRTVNSIAYRMTPPRTRSTPTVRSIP